MLLVTKCILSRKGVRLIMAKLIMANNLWPSHLWPSYIYGKPEAESIMVKDKLTSILKELRIKKVTLVCFDLRFFEMELKSLLLLQCVHFSHHVWQP